MLFWKSLLPEFWHHKERVVEKEGQQYIFRRKWIILILVTCVMTLFPMMISIFMFYDNNKTETVNELLLETVVLSQGVAVDVEIFFDKYLASLRVISSQYTADYFKNKNKNYLNAILKNIQKANIYFSGLNVIDEDGYITFCFDSGSDLRGYKQVDLTGIDKKQDYFIRQIITEKGKLNLVVGLKFNRSNGTKFFLAGIIDRHIVEQFLAKLKFKDIVDIYVMDKNDKLLTSSVYFGKSGTKIRFPVSEELPLSEVISNPDVNQKGGVFLFSGVSDIDNTDMKLGIVMTNRSYRAFMSRVVSHIMIMGFLSIVFVFTVIVLLVTWVVHILYKADQVRHIYLLKAARDSKMASIGQLAAGVAHEINNPLAIINEKAGLLQDRFTFLKEYESDERLLLTIDSIIAAVERAGTITHRLLGFARETDNSIQNVNMADTIEEVLSFIHKEAEYKSININVDIPKPSPQITTDHGKLQQILINLVSNSIAAMDEKGRLTITIKNMKKSIEIDVQDDGCGILKEHQKKIFEPFFTTKSKIGGTGLGLSLTYGLIRDLHGTLVLESSPDVGTTFTITLPYKIKIKG